jgi:hypothetical protein
MTWEVYGKAVARVGDLTVCPKCKGVFAITTGADDLTGFGQAVARHGDKTACGATLIAGQSSAWWDNHSGPDGAASAASANTDMGSHLVAQEAPTICLECLAKAAAAGSAMVVRS